MTESSFLAFLYVFIRCSAMFLSCPIFGAQNTPAHIRVLIAVAVSAALSGAIGAHDVPVPSNLFGLVVAVGHEALAGLLIGGLTSLAMQTMTIAGSLVDLQTGLGSSRAINPLSGVQSTIFEQLKSMLGMVVFLSADAHHELIRAMVHSYQVMPTTGRIEQSFASMLGQVGLISVQIAAPVMAVGFMVDATMALMAKAVPQMQVMHVGLPAKVGVGLVAVTVGLPMTVSAVHGALGLAFQAVDNLFR